MSDRVLNRLNFVHDFLRDLDTVSKGESILHATGARYKKTHDVRVTKSVTSLVSILVMSRVFVSVIARNSRVQYERRGKKRNG